MSFSTGNLAEYIRDNQPVLVQFISSAARGWQEVLVSRASQLPFDAYQVRGFASTYSFQWDKVGFILDIKGQIIRDLIAVPALQPRSPEGFYYL